MAPARPSPRRSRAAAPPASTSARRAAPPARRPAGSQGPPAFLIYGGIVAVAVVALLFVVFSGDEGPSARTSSTQKTEAEPEKPKILTESQWARARDFAADGMRLASDAQSLRDGGDEAGYQRVAKEASAKLDAAIKIWTDWADSVPPEVSDKYSHYGEDVRRWNLKRRSLPR